MSDESQIGIDKLSSIRATESYLFPPASASELASARAYLGPPVQPDVSFITSLQIVHGQTTSCRT